MNSETLFSMALGLQSPWQVDSIEFKTTNEGQKELHLQIGFVAGSQFPDKTGALCKVHDTVDRSWQHLNFFEHSSLLSCRVPRITTSEGRVETVKVPWARPQNGFTLLFEAFAMALIEGEMPVNKIGKLLHVNPHRIWTVFNPWVNQSRLQDDPSDIKKLGIDETSTRKGHKYITVGIDMEKSRVVHVVKGKGKDSLNCLQKYLASQEVKKEQIKEVSIDLSPAFIAGTKESFPKAKITFDRFHVVKLLNEAMDTVRKQERKEHDTLKGHKYIFLKNYEKLNEKQEQALADSITLYPTLGEAYRLKVLFNDLWVMPTPKAAKIFLNDWCAQVEEAKIPAFQKFAKTVKAHWSGIIRFIKSELTNAILEGTNSKIQLAKRRARGFRNVNNLINMVYFLCGKLKFNYPLYSS